MDAELKHLCSILGNRTPLIREEAGRVIRTPLHGVGELASLPVHALLESSWNPIRPSGRIE